MYAVPESVVLFTNGPPLIDDTGLAEKLDAPVPVPRKNVLVVLGKMPPPDEEGGRPVE